MAGPSKTPNGRKQASLTSFFTPRTANGLSQQLPSSPSAPSTAAAAKLSSTNLPDHSRKRPLQDNADGGNDSLGRSSKRVRSVTRNKKRQESEESPANVDDDDDDGGGGGGDSEWTGSASAKPARRNASPSPALHAPHLSGPQNPPSSANSARAERYAYDAARSSGQAAEEEPQDDAATRRKKDELHKKFVKKLGHPDSLTRWRTAADDAGPTAGLDGEDGEAGDDVDEEEPPAPAPKTRKKGAKTGKLTPMEMQFLAIKRKHMDTVLIVEVGYKFKFFGEDARIAAKELSIVCIPGKFLYSEHPTEAHLDKFASASVPVHRLHVHVKRLVAAGHKVGVVRQVETAALKKAGDNRNAPFVRKLTNIYTKGTYIDEAEVLTPEGNGAPTGGHLLCLTESRTKGSGTDEKVDFGIIAVQPATGDIIYDEFEDGFMRREIETRLLHISPCELLIVGDLSKTTDKLVQHLSGSTANVFGDRTRVERVPKSSSMEAEANSHVTQFYAGKVKDGDDRSAALLEKVLHLPSHVITCLSAMITHLTDYGLEHIFDLTKYFQSFSTQQHMLLNGTTLESLEVYRNATDHSEKGSLFWALDKTRTRCGQRLLRKWVGRPLLDPERLQERTDAVQELLEKQSTAQVDRIKNAMRTRTDLERSLIRIFYGRCSRSELLYTLQALQGIGTVFMHVKSPADSGFESRLLADAICTLPTILPIVESFLNKFNADAARRNDKYAFFREEEEDDDITNHKLGILSVEQDLDAHRRDAAAQLSKKAPVTYATVSGIEYLIEVGNADLKRVPASWAKISGTKKLSRFHTPEVVRLLSERDQHKEALAAACDAAFANFLRDMAAEYQPLRDAVSALATLDCLLSLAQVAALPGYSKPEFLPAKDPDTGAAAPASVSIRDGRHPICEHTLPGGYIPFTTSLSGSEAGPVAQLITGPNMGGKSSYVRAVALLVLLAQVGSYVPAAAMRLTPADAIHTRMGARDNLFRGESTFMVEVSETAAIMRAATPRSLVVLDELGRGTSTHDGAAIAHAVLHHAARHLRCLTLFITHYQGLARVADGLGRGRVRCVHMRFTTTASTSNNNNKDARGTEQGEEEGRGAGADEADQEITFLYEVGEGVAHRSYGLNVARLARIPRRVLDVAARKSREMEDGVNARRLRAAAGLLRDVLSGNGGNGRGGDAEGAKDEGRGEQADDASEDGSGDGGGGAKGGFDGQLEHLIAAVDQL